MANVDRRTELEKAARIGRGAECHSPLPRIPLYKVPKVKELVFPQRDDSSTRGVEQPWIPTSAGDSLSGGSVPSAGSSLRICHPPPERKKVALKVDNFATC